MCFVAERYRFKLENAGVVHDLVVYDHQYRDWQGPNLAHSFDRIEALLQANVAEWRELKVKSSKPKVQKCSLTLNFETQIELCLSLV